MVKKNGIFNLRKADNSDIEFLFNLRNCPEVYKYFGNANKVKYEDHIKWVFSIINELRKDISLYLILYHNQRSGQIRFDSLDEKRVEISISVDTKYQGKGVGSKILEYIEEITKKLKLPALTMFVVSCRENLSIFCK